MNLISHPSNAASISAETHFSGLLASLLTMAWFVEARDPYTGGHLWRVSRYSRLLAEAAGFSDADAARIGLGGFLHDLGKVGVPDAILRKPDRLTKMNMPSSRLIPTLACACWPHTRLPRWSATRWRCTMNGQTEQATREA